MKAGSGPIFWLLALTLKQALGTEEQFAALTKPVHWNQDVTKMYWGSAVAYVHFLVMSDGLNLPEKQKMRKDFTCQLQSI